jgi:hypothetical protein
MKESKKFLQSCSLPTRQAVSLASNREAAHLSRLLPPGTEERPSIQVVIAYIHIQRHFSRNFARQAIDN